MSEQKTGSPFDMNPAPLTISDHCRLGLAAVRGLEGRGWTGRQWDPEEAAVLLTKTFEAIQGLCKDD